MAAADADRFEPVSRAGWRAWLAEHHASWRAVWVVHARRPEPGSRPSYDDLVEEALCFGWVDSRSQGLDEERALLYFTPRRPGGGWSRTNKLRVERLERDGLLAPAGRAVIEAARADGSWTLLDSVEALEVPPDLAVALAATLGAAAHWEGFRPSARKQILLWLATARRPETRAARIAETARLAADGVPSRAST